MQQLASSHPARSPGEEQLRDLCERVSLLSTELTRIAALVDRQVTGEDTAIDELPQNDSQTPSDPLSTHPDLVRFEAEITALRDRVDAMARQLTLLILESRATKMREAASAG